MEALGSDFNDVIALERIKQFIYVVVEVAWGPSLFLIRLFQDEKSAAGVLGEDLIGGGTETDGVLLSFAVGTGANTYGFRPGNDVGRLHKHKQQ